MRPLIRLADYAQVGHKEGVKTSGQLRLNWSTVSHYLAKEKPFVLSQDEQGHVDVLGLSDDINPGFDLTGFHYLNLDGLVLLLCVMDAMQERGFLGLVRFPADALQAEALLENGFGEIARRVGRLSSAVGSARETYPDDTFILGRPFVFRATSPSVLSAVQQRMDSFLQSESLLVRLGLEQPNSAGGENRWEWAPHIAEAMHELLKNVVQWSGVGRAIIAMEIIPRTILRLVIADVGTGISSRNPDMRSAPWPDLEPLQWSLLYRFVHREKHGLFTVANTLARWGGELTIRSRDRSVRLHWLRGEQTATQVVDAILAARVERVPFLPGVQVRIDFALPSARPRGT